MKCLSECRLLQDCKGHCHPELLAPLACKLILILEGTWPSQHDSGFTILHKQQQVLFTLNVSLLPWQYPSPSFSVRAFLHDTALCYTNITFKFNVILKINLTA